MADCILKVCNWDQTCKYAHVWRNFTGIKLAKLAIPVCPDWDQVCSLVISHFGVERLDALLYISYLSNVCEAV